VRVIHSGFVRLCHLHYCDIRHSLNVIYFFGTLMKIILHKCRCLQIFIFFAQGARELQYLGRGTKKEWRSIHKRDIEEDMEERK
jgi:hypothetical protein